MSGAPSSAVPARRLLQSLLPDRNPRPDRIPAAAERQAGPGTSRTRARGRAARPRPWPARRGPSSVAAAAAHAGRDGELVLDPALTLLRQVRLGGEDALLDVGRERQPALVEHVGHVRLDARAAGVLLVHLLARDAEVGHVAQAPVDVAVPELLEVGARLAGVVRQLRLPPVP